MSLKDKFQITHREAIELARAFAPTNIVNVKITALGGQKTVGGPNCWLATAPSGKEILLDCGQQITEFEENPPNWALPDFAPVDFDQLLGLILSHAHFDHILGILQLESKRIFQTQPFKIFGKPTERMVLERIFDKANKVETWNNNVQFNLVDGSQGVGEFHIDFYPVNHSIPDSSALVVNIAGKRICYLTDFKYMRNNWSEWFATKKTFQAIGRQGVDILLLDASNITSEGFTPSAMKPSIEFAKILTDPKYQNKRIIVSTFSSDVETLSDWATLANQIGGRPVESDGSTMQFFFENFGIAPSDMQKPLLQNGLPVIFATGCQGEEFSSLNRASRDENIYLELSKNDVVVFASRILPANQQSFNEMLERLQEKVYQVITPEDNPLLHVSGHECKEGLLQAVRDIVPRIVVPCHAHYTNRMMLQHAINADENIHQHSECILLEDGESLII